MVDKIVNKSSKNNKKKTKFTSISRRKKKKSLDSFHVGMATTKQRKNASIDVPFLIRNSCCIGVKISQNDLVVEYSVSNNHLITICQQCKEV